MKKNKKLVSIGIILIIMTGILYVGELNNSSSNMLKLSKGVEQLRQSVKFSFNVPKVLLDEKNLTFNSIGGQLVEIDSTTIKFKAAKFVSDNADISGNYVKYKVDMKYDVSGNTAIKSLRIRTNSDSMDSMAKAVVNFSTEDIAYSLEINKKCNYQSILDTLDLTKEQLKTREAPQAPIINEASSSTNSANASGTAISYDIYTLPSLGYTIRLPKTLSIIKTVTGEYGFKYVAFLISGKVILDIEENNDAKYNTDISKYESLKGGYTLKCFKTNPFESNSVEYNSYDDITNSMDFIVKSFQPIAKAK